MHRYRITSATGEDVGLAVGDVVQLEDHGEVHAWVVYSTETGAPVASFVAEGIGEVRPGVAYPHDRLEVIEEI
jgi:hypothetical protein